MKAASSSSDQSPSDNKTPLPAREMTKRGALLDGVPYGVPKMEYP